MNIAGAPRFAAGCVLACFSLVMGFAAQARADVDLFYVPTNTFQPTDCGDDQIIRIELRALSTNVGGQMISSVSTILNFDPTHLELLGNIPNQAPDFVWSNDFFPNDQDMINPDWTDGDALHVVTAPLGQFAFVPDSGEGLLITTFEFLVLGENTDGSLISIDPEEGQFGETRVLSNTGGNVTGDLSATALVDSADACDCALGDVNLDGFYTLDDIDEAVQVLLGNNTDPDAINAVDANCDDVANGLDIQAFTDFMIVALE